jgi:ABC-type sugar transport system, periplasmic component
MKTLKNMIPTILLSSTMLTGAAFAEPVDVQQYWTSASEAKAMNVLADEVKSRGGEWIDNPASGPDGNIAAAMTRIAGGEPPSAILMTPTSVLTEMAESGLLRDLMPEAEANGWKDVIAPLVWDKLSVDGELVALPIGIQSPNWVWYSKPIFNELGIEEPTSVDEIFAAADKIQEAGYIGIATGGDASSRSQVFFGILLGLGGPTYWNDLFVNRTEEALTSDILVKAFDYYRKASTFEDAGAASRGWNETTNLVASGKAGMQFLGDWAKGEFVAAGQVPGEDFGCFLVPGDETSYAVLIDIFAFPKVKGDDLEAGQLILANSLMDPAVQIKVSEAKGSVPSRSDVDRGSMDACAAKGSAALSTPGAAVTAIWNVVSNDAKGELFDLTSAFYADPSMTSEEAVKQFVATLESL